MKNKEFNRLLKKNKSKSNAGFTLTELLVGLIMGSIVIGGLGWGLLQLLKTTQKGTAEVAARNESSRALDFISDEIKRASEIENTAANARTGTATGQFDDTDTGKTLVLALNIPEVDTSATLGSDGDDTTSERIIYYLEAASGNWKGPQVLYRWGPPLDANGNYTANTWQSEALIDGIDDTLLSATPCGGGDTLTPAIASATGFHACIIGGVPGNTAQLFLTSGVDIGSGDTTTYTADTKVVARARTAPGNTSQVVNSYTMSFRTLNPSFACNQSSDWEMRTDFGDDLSTPSNLTRWNHIQNRQPQAIKIDNNKPLVISSIPRAATGNCLNSRSGNGRGGDTTTRDFSGNQTLGEKTIWKDGSTDLFDVVAISHSIDFTDPRTFNGDDSNCASYPCASTPNGNVYESNTTDLNSPVRMLKYGSVVPNYGGYDANNDGVIDPNLGEQPSLGEFLHTQTPSLADKVDTGTKDEHGNPVYKYTVNSELQPDERIIGFEVGHTDDSSTNPGFDLQDNIFVLKSEAFKEKYSNYVPSSVN